MFALGENVGCLLPLLILVALGTGFAVWRRNPEAVRDTAERLVDEFQARAGSVRDRLPNLPTPAPKAPVAPTPKVPTVTANTVTLYLHNGGVVTGELVERTEDGVTLEWEYGQVTFHRHEIKRLVKGREVEGEEDVVLPVEAQEAVRWPHRHDVVFRLLNGTVLDATLRAFDGDTLELVQELEGGGTVEHTIARAELDQVLFRPLDNPRSRTIQEELELLFPAMRWYEEGMFTVVTDSIAPTVKGYRQAVRELATDWYLTFFPLAGARSPQVQQHLVIFEDVLAYIDYAVSDGVPGWSTLGYFSPTDQVFYAFNAVGESFSELLVDAYLHAFREARDALSAQLQGARHEVFIKGQLSEFLQVFERASATLRQLARQQSLETLRHELTHAMFSNWRLQGIIMSQLREEDKARAEKKREYLEAAEPEEKLALLEELLTGESAEQLPDIRAANSWFIEGLAGYMEPSPVGEPNLERLGTFQSAVDEGRVLPLEFLHTFQLGSFLAMADQATADAYAQSWAFSHYLMHRHREGFLAYLDRLAREQPGEEVDTLPWLLEALGAERRPLEQEFLQYVEQFPAEDPMWLKQKQFFLDLREELQLKIQQLWSR